MSLALREKLIFEYSRPGRGARGQWPPRRRARRGMPAALEAQRAAAAARGQRARYGAPLHAPVAAEFLDRYAFLSARLVHDEVQPAGLQCRGAAAGVRRAPSAGAGDASARGSWPACTSCRKCSRRSPACAAWHSADGRRTRRVCRRGDDPRLSPGARRSGAGRDHRAGGRAWHQSGDRDHVRLRGARNRGRAPTATSTWRRCAPRSARRPRASC